MKRWAHCVACGTVSARAHCLERDCPAGAHRVVPTPSRTPEPRPRGPLSIGCGDRQRDRRAAEGDQGIDVRVVADQPDHGWNQLSQAWAPSSEVWSLTRRATDASNECVEAG